MASSMALTPGPRSSSSGEGEAKLIEAKARVIINDRREKRDLCKRTETPIERLTHGFGDRGQVASLRERHPDVILAGTSLRES